MQPHYYIMNCKKLLRLEAEVEFASLPETVRAHAFDESNNVVLDQDQANWRVVIFRDEIMELEEYTEWLSSPEAMMPQELELDLIAN